jgi:hypothetical protein
MGSGAAPTTYGTAVMPMTCEGCAKTPSFGLPAETRSRWCSTCARAHHGAVSLQVHKTCEGCAKTPSFGLLAEGRRRWCGACARAHHGAVSLQVHKTCEGCAPTLTLLQ